MSNINEFLEEHSFDEEVVIFSNPSYKTAFLGVSIDGKAIYSYGRMVQSLMQEDNMTDEDAMEFIAFNTIRSLPYQENAPIIIYEI